MEKLGMTRLTCHSAPPLPRGHSVGSSLDDWEGLGLDRQGQDVILRIRKARDLDVCIKTSTAIFTLLPLVLPSYKYLPSVSFA